MRIIGLLRKIYRKMPTWMRPFLSVPRSFVLYLYFKIKYRKNRSGLSADITLNQFKANILAFEKDYKGVFVQLATIPWKADLFQRPQHMSVAFANSGYLVVYITTYPEDNVHGFRKVRKNLWLASNHEFIEYLKNPVMSTYSTVSVYDNKKLRDFASKGKLVYEYIDHLDAEISGDAVELLKQNFKFAVGEENIKLMASAAALKNDIKKECTCERDVMIIPNGVDISHYENYDYSKDFVGSDLMQEFCKSFKCIVGYFGAIAPWLWYDEINKLIDKRKDIGFVFIGPDYAGASKNLKKQRNLLMPGAVQYEELPSWAQFFDICIIPFKPGRIAQTTSPLKLFEYLAMKKPVIVTSDMLECIQFEEVLKASNSEQFSAAIDRAMLLKTDRLFKDRCFDIAKAHSWKECAKKYEMIFN